MNYDIQRKTTSTDAAPEALQGTHYWYDSKTTENGEIVYYDNLTGSFAYWTHATLGQIVSAITDVGGAPTDYFKAQDYPDYITANGGGWVNYELPFDSFEAGSPKYSDGADFVVNTGFGVWSADTPVGIQTVASSDYLPPKTGWGGDLTLEYTIPANQFVGQGAWSGTITVGEYVIADAWYRAETTAFESFRSYAGNVEERDCFRGYLPIDEFGDPTDADCWMFTSGGSDVFNIERLYGDNANWCSLRTDARFESVWQTRQKAMDFSGLVMAWLKETGNMREVDSIEWVQLTDITAEPEIYISKGRTPRLFWRVTIPLEMVYKTENIFE